MRRPILRRLPYFVQNLVLEYQIGRLPDYDGTVLRRRDIVRYMVLTRARRFHCRIFGCETDAVHRPFCSTCHEPVDQ